MREHRTRQNVSRPDPSDEPSGTHSGPLRRELLELAAVFVAGAAAHTLVLTLGHTEYGAQALIGLGTALIAVVFGHRWWQQRRRGTRSRALLPASPSTQTTGLALGGEERLWRIRAGVEDVPGGLATLTTQLARLGVNIRLLQIHPGYTGTVDEFLATSPPHVGPAELTAAIVQAGGRDPVIRNADIHEFSDTTSRTLTLVSALIAGEITAEAAMANLSGATRVQHGEVPPPHVEADDFEGTTMCLSDAQGGLLVLERDDAPFTAVEFARCRALMNAAASLSAVRQRTL